MNEDSKLIPLSQGAFAKVDATDYAWLSQWKWSLHITKSGNRYAVRGYGPKGHRRIARMHQEIMKTIPGVDPERETDHWDGDGLNNTRGNLRQATRAQNNFNRKKVRGISQFKGVFLRKKTMRWSAEIKANKHRIFLGEWSTGEEAAVARDDAARFLHGEFAALNLPERKQGFFAVEEIRKEAKRRSYLRRDNAHHGRPCLVSL